MSLAPPVVRLTGAGRRFGGHEALLDVDLTVRQGERVAVLLCGANVAPEPV